ncbi:hypothetical protein VTO42DRAFT_5742 [Malbranchea cinnamomea]
MPQIAAASSQCLSLFDTLCSKLSDTGVERLKLMPLDSIQTEQGRLRAWHENLDAVERGHSLTDLGLLESAGRLSTVVKLLHHLHTALSESIAIVSSFISSSAELQAKSEVATEDENETDESVDLGRPPLNNELLAYQRSIVEIVGDLCVLGTKSNFKPLDLAFAPEAQPMIETDVDSRYAEYDRRHVSELCRELRQERVDPEGTYDYIIPRLAAAVTLRRKRFKYWERHSKIRTTDPSKTTSRNLGELESSSTCSVTRTVPENGDIAYRNQARKLLPEENGVSDLGASLCEIVQWETADSAAVASLQSGEDAVSHLYPPPPPPPVEGTDADDFICPYCWKVCPAKYRQLRLWRSHILHDVQPYICTYENCPQPEQLYGSRRQWMEHEIKFHCRLWRCHEHQTSIYNSEELSKDHFCQGHKSALSEGQLQDLVDPAVKSCVNDRYICPICLSAGPFDSGLHNHLARHLERVAAFALPRNSIGAENLTEEPSAGSIKSCEIDQRTCLSQNTDRLDELEPKQGFGDTPAAPFFLHSSHNELLSDLLLSAVFAGNTAQVYSLLRHGADPRATDGDFTSALTHAAKKGFGTIARMLLDHGADPNYQFLQESPLIVAVHGRHYDIVELLFEYGAAPTVVGYARETLLMTAAFQGDVRMVRLLAERGVDPDARSLGGTSALSLAAQMGHLAVVKLLLDCEVEVDSKDYEMRTPLSLAAGNGHEAVAKFLLDHGADPHYTDGRGMSPLSWAAENGHGPVVEMLLERGTSFNNTILRISSFKHENIVEILMRQGVNPDLEDWRGRTPLLIAATEGCDVIAKLLLDGGADPNAMDLNDRTPLLAAACEGNFEIVELLLAKGADPNLEDQEGRTPLSWAAERGHLEIVRALLDAGCRVRSQHHVGPEQSPLLYAAANGHASIVQLLLCRGAEHSVVSRDGETPLLKAAKVGSFLTVVVLLCAGADPNVHDNRGQTALTHAISNGDKWMAEVLRLKGARPRRLQRN